jgi:hypothetical protein
VAGDGPKDWSGVRHGQNFGEHVPARLERVCFYSRHGAEYTGRPHRREVRQAATQSAILDGELCLIDPGAPHASTG